MDIFYVLNSLNNGFQEMNNHISLRHLCNNLNLPYDIPISINNKAYVVFPYDNKPYSLAGMNSFESDYNSEIEAITWINEHGGALQGRVFLLDTYIGNIVIAHSLFQSVFVFYQYIANDEIITTIYTQLYPNKIKQDKTIDINMLCQDISLFLYEPISRCYPTFYWVQLPQIAQNLLLQTTMHNDAQSQILSRNSLNNQNYTNNIYPAYQQEQNFGTAVAKGMTAGAITYGTAQVVKGKLEQVEETAERKVGQGVEFVGNGVEASGRVIDNTGKFVETTGKGVHGIGKGVEYTGKGIENVGRGIETTGKGVEKTGQVMQSTGQNMQSAGESMKTVGSGIATAGQAGKQAGSAIQETAASLDSTGIGALAGIPLHIIGAAVSAGSITTEVAGKATEITGTATNVTGKVTEVTGKGVEVTGNGMQSLGKATQKVGQTTQKVGTTIQDTGDKLQDIGGNIRETGQNVKQHGQDIQNSGRYLQEQGNFKFDMGTQHINNRFDTKSSSGNIHIVETQDTDTLFDGFE